MRMGCKVLFQQTQAAGGNNLWHAVTGDFRFRNIQSGLQVLEMELVHAYAQRFIVAYLPAMHGQTGDFFLRFIIDDPQSFGKLVKLRMGIRVKGFVPQHVLHHMAELPACHYIPVHFFVKRLHFL